MYMLSHSLMCNSLNCSLPSSSVHRILQARILEGVVDSFSCDVPTLVIEPMSPVSLALQIEPSTTEPPGKSKKTAQQG